MLTLAISHRFLSLLRPLERSCPRALADPALLTRQHQASVSSARHASSKADAGNGTMKHVYVHPLSQIVLECLQSNYSEWLVRRQLHSNTLSFYRDGTFEIKVSEENSTKSRIWTSFDTIEKRHWLTVQRGTLFGRYLLQDNLMSAWQGNRKGSLPDRIHKAVKEMIEEIEDFERKHSRRL